MRLVLHTSGLERTEELEALVERRLRYALDRYWPQLPSVHVSLSDLNGPRGGKDISCVVRTRLPGRGALVVRQTAADALEAVGNATRRAAHALGRRLRKRGERRRGRARGMRRRPRTRGVSAAAIGRR